MNKISERANYFAEKLEKYNPVVLDYGKDKVVGFANDLNGVDLAVYFKQDEAVMTFAYQNAHFAADDAESLVSHVEKFLNGTLASVEFFGANKTGFGGSRESKSCVFNTVDDVVNCYAAGVESAKNGLYDYFKSTPVTVRAINFTNTVNTTVNVTYKDGDYIVAKIK